MNLDRQKAETEKQDFKARLAKRHGLEGHPKLDRCFELAWSYGHAFGFSEVNAYFADLADLLK